MAHRTSPRAAPFRLAYVLFRSRFETWLFRAELRQRGFAHLPADRVRELTVADELSPQFGVLRGWAVVAIISPNPDNPEWVVAAPTPISHQPGVARQARIRELLMERSLLREEREAKGEDDADMGNGRHGTALLRPMWDMLIPDYEQHDERRRLVQEPELSPDVLAELATVERVVEAHWRRDPRYFQSVDDLLAYTRRKTEARRRPRTSDAEVQGWLGQAQQKALNHQQALATDQAEIAAALATPRRGRKHAEDTDWLELEHDLRAQGVLRHVYRATQPQPPRPRRKP